MTVRQFEGRHALVTGGSRGIGLAIGRRLAEQGAVVTLLGRDEGRLQLAVRESGAAGHEVADVTHEEGFVGAIRAAEARHGAVEILVNNAGAAETAPFMKMSKDAFRRMMAVNVESIVIGVQAVLPGMLATDYGRIINVASTAGLKGYRYVSSYVAAKHAVIGLTRSLALETASTGVTVNAVCPGFTDTDLVRGAIAKIVAKTGRSQEDVLAEFVADNPQGRLIDPDEVADGVCWLARTEARGMTGQSIAVAGGEVM